MKDRIVFDAKVSDRKILLIPAGTIVGTPYNPAARTKDGAKLRKLAESVGRYGLIQPLVITADRDLVDGNRRLAACKLAGLQDVECIILPQSVNKDEVFCEVNTTAEKIGGKGWLEACRHGYKTPPAEVKSQYDELFRLIGTYGIDMLIEKKVGLNILGLCKQAKAQGLAIRLDELIFKVAQGRLTNRLNAIIRSEATREDRCAQMMGLLS